MLCLTCAKRIYKVTFNLNWEAYGTFPCEMRFKLLSKWGVCSTNEEWAEGNLRQKENCV